MPDSYRSNERQFWDKRIRQMDRYSAVGHRSLPGTVNQHRKESLFNVIDSVLENHRVELQDSHVLDAGCGTGIYAAQYESSGARVTGIDLSFEAVRSARESEIDASFCVGALSDIPFPDGRFDIVHVFSVLYHIADDEAWEASLEELFRVLRPGGILLMRIAWVKRASRIAEHVRHRGRSEYLRILQARERMELLGVRSFRDVVPFQPLFWLGNRLLPGSLAERMGLLIKRFDLLKENKDQKVVVFRKSVR